MYMKAFLSTVTCAKGLPAVYASGLRQRSMMIAVRRRVMVAYTLLAVRYINGEEHDNQNFTQKFALFSHFTQKIALNGRPVGRTIKFKKIYG